MKSNGSLPAPRAPAGRPSGHRAPRPSLDPTPRASSSPASSKALRPSPTGSPTTCASGRGGKRPGTDGSGEYDSKATPIWYPAKVSGTPAAASKAPTPDGVAVRGAEPGGPGLRRERDGDAVVDAGVRGDHPAVADARARDRRGRGLWRAREHHHPRRGLERDGHDHDEPGRRRRRRDVHGGVGHGEPAVVRGDGRSVVDRGHGHDHRRRDAAAAATTAAATAAGSAAADGGVRGGAASA